MPSSFGLASQEWKLEDSESDDFTPEPPRHKREAAARKPVLPQRVRLGEHVRKSQDTIDPEPSQPFSQTQRRSSYWSRWDLWMYCGVLAAASAVILGFPFVGKASPPGSKASWNVLQTHTMTPAKFDISALDLACRGSPLPICELAPSLHDLDLNSSHNNHEIESLGFHLGTLLRPTKMATREEECLYFAQLQLDIHQAGERTRKIQDSLKAGLDATRKALSLIARSRSDAEERLRGVDEEANGGMWKIGSRHDEREKAYRDNKRWLGVFEDYTRKLESRDATWDWELGRQSTLEKDLKAIEQQIQGMKIGISQSHSADSSCTAFNMQQVERRFRVTMMRAAENDTAANQLDKYYDAL